MERMLTTSKFKLRKICIAILLMNCIGVTQNSYAANPNVPIPGSVDPGVISQQLSREANPAAQAMPSAGKLTAAPTESALGPEAEKIHFKLNSIILVGNTIYPEK